jgi:L-asparaginase/Glu-tRNA(Gln) amidotransferase subunit D
MMALGAKGIVIAGVGAGAPNSLDKEIEEIIKTKGAVVVQSSRVGSGRMCAATIGTNRAWSLPTI